MPKTEIKGRDIEGGPLHLMVEDGLITAVDRSGNPGTATLLPAMVDAHCHILPTGIDMAKPSLAECTSHAEVLDIVGTAARSGEGWLHITHYDQNRFSGQGHLDRWKLDQVSQGRPVLLRHSNGHAGVANSAALEAALIREDVKNPPGGEFVRGSDSRLTGVLLERASEFVTSAMPVPGLDQMVEAVSRALDSMAALGIASATDMMTGRWDLEREVAAYAKAAARPGSTRARLFVQWSEVFGARGVGAGRLSEIAKATDTDRCKVCGIKIFADGAIASATAAIHGEYLTTPSSGTLMYDPERLKSMVVTAHDAGWPVAVHAIGDRAVDLVLDAFEATNEPSRHRLEHAMMLSDAQIERIHKAGCHVTMQPEFLVRFGQAYAAQLGPERARSLKRVKSLLDAGIPMSLSSDRPIVPGDPWDGILAASQRPPGFDPDENVTLTEAMRLYSTGGAEANGDAKRSGRLAPGMWADVLAYADEPGKGRPHELWIGGVSAASA
ncbi:MAG: amidohydrolase [Fimbriimonadaceae bacterium]